MRTPCAQQWCLHLRNTSIQIGMVSDLILKRAGISTETTYTNFTRTIILCLDNRRERNYRPEQYKIHYSYCTERGTDIFSTLRRHWILYNTCITPTCITSNSFGAPWGACALIIVFTVTLWFNQVALGVACGFKSGLIGADFFILWFHLLSHASLFPQTPKGSRGRDYSPMHAPIYIANW